MEIELFGVEYQEEERRIVATISYREQQPSGVWHSARVSIFLDWIDSYEEIKRQAMEKSKAFLMHATSAH